MVTMVRLPEKKVAHKLVHLEDNELLLTTLEVYTATTLIELARKGDSVHAQPLVRKRKLFVDDRSSAIVIPSCTMSCAFVPGSWSKLAWSVVTWTLLVCLLMAGNRKERHSGDGERATQDFTSCSLSRDHRALLSSLPLDGALTFSNTSSAAADFGLIHFSQPGAVVYPKSVRDIELVVRAVQSDTRPGLTLAAKGRGHSVHGQAQVRLQNLLCSLCEYFRFVVYVILSHCC
jgi:hypothetical protein